MKLRIFLSIALIFGITINSIAQFEIPQLNKVKIGDKVSAYSLTGMLNYPQSAIKLTDFPGKILILDFWTFGCTSCVASWPKLLKLQEAFKDQIQIVIVNPYNSAVEVERFLNKQEKISGFRMTLPSANGDKNLLKLFPHLTVPHVVYIDQDGIVKYIENSLFLTSETIQNLIERKEMYIPEKTDIIAKVDWSKPLYLSENTPVEDKGKNLIWNSMLVSFTPSLGVAYFTKQGIETSFGYFANYDVKSMFQMLYGRLIQEPVHIARVPNANVLFIGLDSTKFVGKVNDLPIPQNAYTIQLITNTSVRIEDIRKRMISYIEHCFGIKTYWVKQTVKCLVLKRSHKPIPEYKTGATSCLVRSYAANLNNVSIQEFIESFVYSPDSYKIPYPVVDETNFKGKLGNIEITSQGEKLDYRILSRELEKFGLIFSLEDREANMLVITSQPENLSNSGQ